MDSRIWCKPYRIGARLLTRTMAALALLLVFSGIALAANPAAVQTYFVPVPEDKALTSMRAISTDATPPIWTYVSVAIGTNGTLVYYDQWENGYDTDIANPANLYSVGNPGGTQIWGNGVAADGCAPNVDGKTALACTDANDALASGNVIVLANAVDPTTLQSVIDFDGGDKIGSTQQVAVSRVYWPNKPRTLLAAAIEMYPTNEWGRFYQSPVGEDNDYNSMFQYTSMAIQASLNGTQVTVDTNGPNPGGTQAPVVLNQGQSLIVDGIDEAATVVATFPVQVHLLTGDRGSSYEYSGYTLNPTEDWGSRYYSPVGVVKSNNNPPIQTQITLFNGSATPLTVRCRFRNGTTNYAVGPFTSTILAVPDRSGAECISIDPPGAPFVAISTVDSAALQGKGGETWDWGFTLLPEEFLSPQALVGLGLGRDPTSTASISQNGSPVYVTAVCAGAATSTYVYADFNGDGSPDTVDLNGDNDTNDTVDGISESTSNTGMLVTELQSVRLFDPVDRDQTGMRITSRVSPNNTGDAGCDIAAIWGEDPNVASAGEPGFDVGTSVPPLRSFTGLKTAEVAQDADGNGYLTPGDTLTYTIESQNTGIAPIPTMTLTDTIPTGTSYVPGSTYADLGSGWVQIPDNVLPETPFPLDGAGVSGSNMPVGATWRVRFIVTIDPLDQGVCNLVISNTAYINGQGKDFDVEVISIVQCTAQIIVEKAVRGLNPPVFDFTGEAFFEVTPPDGSPANDLPERFFIQPPPNGSTAVSATVPTGVYTITEEVEPGWTLYDIQCTGGGVPSLVDRSVVINVFGPITVKCTFYNELPGTLVVEKFTDPAVSDQLFDFEGGPLSTQDGITGTLQGGDSVTYTVRPGLYFVTETVPLDWTLLSIRCVDPTSNSFPVPDPNPGEILGGGKGGALYDIDPAETVTCTWKNGLLAALGDNAWEDVNKNGIQDAGEPAFANVPVSLYSVGSPTTAEAADTLVASTVTDGLGAYEFVDLVGGVYYVTFTVPSGFTPTLANQGGDPTVVSVIDATGRSPNIVLPIGGVNLDIDAGFYTTPTADTVISEPGTERIFLPAIIAR